MNSLFGFIRSCNRSDRLAMSRLCGNLAAHRLFSKQLFLIGLSLLAIALLLVVSGCTHANPPSTLSSPLPAPSPFIPSTDESDEPPLEIDLSPWEEAKILGPQNMSVSGVEFESPPERELVGFHTFRVKSGVVITAPYHYLTRSDETTKLRLFVLLDEKQLRGGIGNDPDALYTDVTIEPSTEITLPFTLPPLTPGAHSCIIISILNPDAPTGLNASLVTLLAGNTDEPVPRNYVTMSDTDSPFSRVRVLLHLTEVTDKPDSPEALKKWETTRTFPGAVVEYAIHAGYQSIPYASEDERPKEADLHHIAVLAFMDHKQIPIQIDGEIVFYGQLSQGIVGRQVGSFQAPREPGAHNLLVLLIENPSAILGDIVRGPDEPGPASLLLWGVDGQDVAIQVEEN